MKNSQPWLNLARLQFNYFSLMLMKLILMKTKSNTE